MEIISSYRFKIINYKLKKYIFDYGFEVNLTNKWISHFIIGDYHDAYISYRMLYNKSKRRIICKNKHSTIYFICG